ncbi:MAG: GNAT family N-acetyltransferase [Chitinophagaceae bacterium]|nr:GNAT family N-acetyltransferase [Chitinophagaceae bacterium]
MNKELSVIDYTSPFYEDVLHLRNEVLRKPIGLNLFEEDLREDRDQYIIIATDVKTLMGCIMLKIVDEKTVKFRQMAIYPNYQQQGIGRGIMHYAEIFCLLNEYHKVELHARISAKDFYSRLGYQTVGEEFEEVGIPHIKMVKSLLA